MLKVDKVERFQGYSQFESINEFNTHIAAWMAGFDEEFTKGEKLALERLTRYSVKIVGVATAKIGTILKSIHEEYNGNGISRSTFKRMLVKAKQIGMLQILEMKRQNGGQSSNLYIFQRYTKLDNSKKNTPELPSNKKMNHHKTITSIKTNLKEIKKRNQPTLDHTFTMEYVPIAFRNIMKCFFDNAETIEEYWKMVKISAYKNNYETNTHAMTHIAINALKQTIRAIKQKQIKKPIAYFYTIVQNKFEQRYYTELYDMGCRTSQGTDTWLAKGAFT